MENEIKIRFVRVLINFLNCDAEIGFFCGLCQKEEEELQSNFMDCGRRLSVKDDEVSVHM